MANYTTSSRFSELVGSMVVTNGFVESYINSANATGTLSPPQPPPTRFTVRFGSGRAYNINATANGTGYSGTANNNGPAADQEAWSATASTTEMVDDPTPDAAHASEDDTAAKKAAS